MVDGKNSAIRSTTHISKKRSTNRGISKTARGSRRIITENEETLKEVLLKKIKEKDDRVAQLLAKKEQEKIRRQQLREAEDLYKKSVLNKIKEEDERKRQETLRKILSKGKRADELLKERELLAIAGRLNAVEVRERLERIWEKTSRRSRSFKSRNAIGRDNAFREKN